MKEIKKCIFPALNPFANQLESWLCKMANKGWILTDAKGLGTFVFIKGMPADRKYFFHLGWKGCKFDFDYGMAKTLYQQSSNVRRLNKDAPCLFEVDNRKIDERFTQYVSLRNRQYIKHYSLLFCVLLAYSVAFIVGCILNFLPAIFLIFVVAGAAWSAFAVIILSVSEKRLLSFR